MKRLATEKPSFILLLLLFLLTQQALSQCYYPNGTQETDPAYQPCPGFDGRARMCCATNRTNPFGGAATNGWTANKCLPNGLCLDGATTIDQHGKTVLVQQYWRDLCTSRNWNDGGCLMACASNANDRTTRMTPCGNPNTSTTWCCGDNTDCCNSSSAEYIAATLQGYVLPSSTASTVSGSTAASTSGATPATTSVSPTAASLGGGTSGGLSTGAKAGIGVGVGVGAVMLLAGLAWTLMKKRRSRAALGEETRPNHRPVQSLAELEGAEAAKELPSNSKASIQELPGH